MKIHVLTNDGSPLGVTEKSLSGEDGRLGVGGAELALLTMCAGWQLHGYDVTLYNNPREGGASSFEQKTLDEFDPNDDRDYLIIFRSPNHRIAAGANGKKIWWSCDQYTVGDFKNLANQVDKIVTISPYHSNYLKNTYGIQNTIPIDLPVRTWEYKKKLEKVPKRCIFTSIPDRGIMPLHAAWAQIVARIPDASLVITSDWRLWSELADVSLTNQFRLHFAQLPNVTYKGAVKREELLKIQLEAQLHLYPCTYEELFCIAVAESQAAGVYPITSNCGALMTTNMGMVITGNPTQPDWIEAFVNNAVSMLNDPKLSEKQEVLREAAMKRFSIDNILEQWEEKVFTDE